MNTKKLKEARYFQRSALTKAILPVLTATVVGGCMNTTPENNSGLYDAGENEVVVYYKRDVAAASCLARLMTAGVCIYGMAKAVLAQT